MIKEGFTKPSERINRLRKMTVESTPYIESERALLITESYVESEGLSPIIRRAKALDKIFNNIPITIREDELIVGSMTKNPRGAGIYPEFSCKWIEEELKTMGNGNIGEFQILKETAEELREVFKYWKGKTTSELAKSYMAQVADNCMKNQVFTIENYFYEGVGNVCVDYGKVLEKGFRGIIFEVIDTLKSMDVSDPEYIKKQQFYEAVIISYNAAIKFAHRYAAKAREMAESESREDRKAELLYIAEVCDKVPEYGASNFYEACQSFWFVQVILQIESNGHSVSPGRFDQYMYKYYKNDKSITKEFAQELIDCIFIKLNDIKRFCKKSLTKDSTVQTGLQNICIGGQNKEGFEVSNELSYMCMEAAIHVKLQEPLLSIRICKEIPNEFIYKAYEVAQLGLRVLSI